MEIIYNSELFDQLVTLTRYNESGTEEEYAVMHNEHVQSIRLINEIEYPYPVLEIMYADVGDVFQTNFRADGFSTIEIILNPNEWFGSSRIKLTFILDFVELVAKNTNESYIRLTGVSEHRFNFNSKIEYSTGSDKLGRPTAEFKTDILQDLLHLVDIPFRRTEFFTTTDKKGSFIAHANKSALENINDVLHGCTSIQFGLYTLFFDLTENECVLSNFKKYMDTFELEDTVEGFNYFTIHDDDNQQFAGTSISNIKQINAKSANNLIMMTSEADVPTFEYSSRLWSRETFYPAEYKNIAGSFNEYTQRQSKKTNIIHDIPPHLDRSIFKHTRETLNGDHSVYVDDIYELFMHQEQIQFTAVGVIQRDVGDIIRLKQSEFHGKPRYEGYWIIKRIIHELKAGQFINNIIAVRPNIKDFK